MGAPPTFELKAWLDQQGGYPTTVGNPPDADREPEDGPMVVGTNPSPPPPPPP